MALSPPLYSRIPHSPRHPSPLSHAYPTRPRPAAPMTIPHSDHRSAAAVPPPLPPPKHFDDLNLSGPVPAWAFNNNPNWQGFGPSSRPNVALQSRPRTDSEDLLDTPNDMDLARRLSSAHTLTTTQEKDELLLADGSRTPSDEGQSSSTSPTRLHGERQLERKSLNTSSQAYDRNLLSKIGGPNTPLRLPSLSSSVGDAVSTSPGNSDARAPAIKRISVPDGRRSSNDSCFSSRQSSTVSSILSLPPSFRSNSIFDAPEVSRNGANTYRQANSDECPPPKRVAGMEDHATERNQMRDLNLNDRNSVASVDLFGARAGMKRRASSPQRDIGRHERSSLGGLSVSATNDLYHRRSLQQFPPRSDPSARQNYPQHHGSVSSVSSSYGLRTPSLSSSLAVSIASSATSLGSGRLSPSLQSPNLDPELSAPGQYTKSLNPSPRSSVAVHSLTRHALESAAHSATTMTDSPAATQAPKIPGIFICDCCPKKPKKFSNEEDLRLHHMEKQYTCAYCSNRFKNKNEAERHQNSLHLRRHSWSCAALQSIEHAFHPSHSNGGATDVCGYCGEEFSNPADWAARRYHVSSIHKFGECNQVKKFFRADHFRQHLKHSHGGTSGKWTNVLETVCMRDEPLPQPINRTSTNVNLGYYGHAPATGAPLSSSGAPTMKPDTISEVPQER